MSERNVGRMVGLGCGLVALAFIVMCGLSSVLGVLFSAFDEGLAIGPSDYGMHEEEVPEWLLEQQEGSAEPTGPLLPPPPRRPVDSRPLALVLVVAEASGARAPAQVGESCRVTLTRPERSGSPGEYWCHADIRCGDGALLYGGEHQGFFTCTTGEGSPPAIVGTDGEATQIDQDAAFALDTVAQTFSLSDDSAGALGAYSLRGRVDEITFAP